jgi:simple sugar transport system permease protein
MLNNVVAAIARWLGNALIFEGGTARGAVVVEGARLPELGFHQSAASIAALFALAAAGVVWTLRARSWSGARWRAVGAAPPAAAYLGIRVARTQVAIMAASGALAGLAAINFVLGHKHAFEEGLGRNYGFLGVAVGLIGRSHPAGVVVAALVIGFLSQGGQTVPDMVPKELTELLLGASVLAVAIAAPIVNRLAARPR